MAADQDGWYIAEPDGTTTGPMSRAELLAAPASGQYSSEALAWHVDVAEWHPLLKVVAASGGSSQRAEDAAPARGEGSQRAATAERGIGSAEAAAAAWSQAASSASSSTAPAAAATRKDERRARKQRARQALMGSADDGRRLLSQLPARAAVEAAKAKANAAWAERKAAATAQPGKPVATGAGPARAALAEGANTVAILGRRLLARLLDSATLGLVGAALLWGAVRSLAVNGQLGPVDQAPPLLLLLILALVALMPIEALALALAGATPGKAWLGLSVRRSDGSRPGVLRAWRRSFEVLWRGLGFGIPVLSLITLIVALAQTIKRGAAHWDTNNGLEVRAAPLAAGRFQIAVFALIGLWLLLSSDSFPRLVLEIANAPWAFRR